MEDIERFMREDEAEKTITLFEGALESKKISKKALKNWVVSIGICFLFVILDCDYFSM